MENKQVIKKCIDPHCDAIFHNCPKNKTHCKDCNGRMIEINLTTYWKNFADLYFQYDYQTHEIYRLQKTENTQYIEVFNLLT